MFPYLLQPASDWRFFSGVLSELFLFLLLKQHLSSTLTPLAISDSLKSSLTIDEQHTVSHENTVHKAGTTTFAEGLSALIKFPPLKEVEQLIISEALNRSNGNQAIAAQLLGLSRHALNKRLIRAQNLSNDE